MNRQLVKSYGLTLSLTFPVMCFRDVGVTTSTCTWQVRQFC